MPVYLLHGFRWTRQRIRIHIIFQNLDDCASEWLMAPATSAALLENFHMLYPDVMKHLPSLRFVEQYDPADEGCKTQPYAYVADVIHEVKLGVEVDEIRGKGLTNEQWAAMMELRDKVAKDSKIAWFVVVCGDEERWAPPLEEDGCAADYSSPGNLAEYLTTPMASGNLRTLESPEPNIPESGPEQITDASSASGLKKWLGIKRGLRSEKSMKNLRQYSNSRLALRPSESLPRSTAS